MIGEALALVGSVLLGIAALGVVRFTDPLARMHALAKGSTLGLLLMLVGAALNLTDANNITSVVLAGAVHVLTSIPASNMVSRATYLAEGIPSAVDVVDEGAEPLGLSQRPDRPT